MKTREYAEGLRKIADFLDSRPEFSLPKYSKAWQLFTYYDKEEFTNAAKALGDAKKTFTSEPYAEFRLESKTGLITLGISRDRVCKKTITYECEPLFSEEEIEKI